MENINMAGNSFGKIFVVTTFGESHGPALGCVIDGCPAGIPINIEDIRRELQRRRPNTNNISTTRIESDEPEIFSGIFEGKSLGTPIVIIIRNTNQKHSDYDLLKDIYRPSHADWTWENKYGIRDHRGGGRSSGRESVSRVAAGSIAKQFLLKYGINIRAWTSAIAGINVIDQDNPDFDLDEIEKNPLKVPHKESAEKIMQELEKLRAEGDSAGGIVSCLVTGLPSGLGEPVFEKLHSRLASGILSIGSVKGIEFGAGFSAAGETGSSQNDIPTGFSENALFCKTNNSGGILGGISTGMPLKFKVAFKPPPSISKVQETIDRQGNVQELIIQGRHDTCIIPRVIPVVEAMVALVLADFILLRRCNR